MSERAAPLFDDDFLRRLEVLQLVARRAFAGRLRAERRAKRKGAGLEFADHRDYAPGDDLRTLDWSIYGRLGRLLVRLFEEEEDLFVYLLVDRSASMRFGTPPKLDYARQLVAALAYVALANLDRVSVASVGERLGERLPPARGKGRIFRVLDVLRGLAPAGETRLATSIEAFVHTTRRRGLVVVASDFYDPAGFEAGLNLLRHHRFEPLALHVVDEAEARPTLLGDVEIVDCETGERRELTVTPRLAEAIAREHERHAAALEAWCAARGVAYLRASTAQPFDVELLRLFRRGGFLG